MSDSLNLFEDTQGLQPIPIVDAEVRFAHAFYRAPQSTQYMDKLLHEIAWRQESIVLWGKEHLQPRLSAWYGDPGCAYSYSGRTFEPHPWSDTLLQIKDDIERATAHRFNSVLLNLYRDERDSMGWHSDDEPELGAHPAIASLSLGATRVFKLRHRTKKHIKPIVLALTDGSLLLMTGSTQRFWRHAVDKERESTGARINLTFRTIIPRP
jgi:alkylated DNA repair dioxygenase AlkB